MSSSSILKQFVGRVQRCAAAFFFRRPIKMRNAVPCISFAFDDFPCSAWRVGGSILARFGLRGTYYASLGLMDGQAPTGTMFSFEDLKAVHDQGHELGCHTFGHCHAWDTRPGRFGDSMDQNQRELGNLLPGAAFRTMSYPICVPRPGAKRRAGRRYACCRGGGQTFNTGIVDLNMLRAFFLEKSRDNPRLIWEIIDRNRQAGGWLILSTHDLSPNPTPFGCVPSLFEEVVKRAIESGAKVLPVVEALGIVCGQGFATGNDRNLADSISKP